jgi:hypothetical protein
VGLPVLPSWACDVTIIKTGFMVNPLKSKK